jgi:hypothetical protein
MRKQLEEIKNIDQYILHELSDEERAVMDTKMILSPRLREHWWQQVQLHKLIRGFARAQKRKELHRLHENLMSDPVFNQQIRSIFS